jgi:signal transduction histidine kinase
MSSSRPAPWVAPVLYGAVLVTGLVVGTSRWPWFVGGLVALIALELVGDRLPAAVLLGLRVALFLGVSAVDESGLSKVLFVLVPFTAYFAFGRTVSIVLGAACVGLAVVTTPEWHAEQLSDLVMFSLGLVLAIAMAAVVVEERRGRDRLAELSAAAERNRVARDVHDGLGHHLTAIVVLLEKATAFRELDPEAANRAIVDAGTSARRALEDVRESVGSLRAEPFRLSPALRELVAGQPDVTLDLIGDESGFDATTLTALYRAAQEGITNSRRHADAGRIAVSVALDAPRARLTVADDGRGFSGEREGFGLLGMRERVQLAGGRVDVVSDPGRGTRLTVTIP